MKKIFTIVLLAIAFTQTHAQDESSSPWQFGALYIGDAAANMSGGIKTGATYLGMANITVDFDFEKAKLWKGGNLFVRGANTHGGTPTATFIGDFQVVSNIEAGNHTYVQELWYKQQLGKFEIIAGIQDLNVEYAVCDHACNFINSSFGVYSTFANNMSIPIFPLTALGLSAKWNITDKLTWQLSIFDGNIDDWENNPYNLNWSINDGSLLFVSEFVLKTTINNKLNGSIKLGGYYHNKEENYGGYVSVNQLILKDNLRSVEAFAQVGFAPKDINPNNFYYGMGLNLIGFINPDKQDVLGFGLAHAHFSDNRKHETTLELTYKYQLTDNIYIQPDLQYVINPSGETSGLNNAFVGIIRLGLEF